MIFWVLPKLNKRRIKSYGIKDKQVEDLFLKIYIPKITYIEFKRKAKQEEKDSLIFCSFGFSMSKRLCTAE